MEGLDNVGVLRGIPKSSLLEKADSAGGKLGIHTAGISQGLPVLVRHKSHEKTVLNEGRSQNNLTPTVSLK